MGTLAEPIRVLRAFVCRQIPKIPILTAAILAGVSAFFGALIELMRPFTETIRMVRAFVCCQVSDIVVLASAVLAINFCHDRDVIVNWLLVNPADLRIPLR